MRIILGTTGNIKKWVLLLVAMSNGDCDRLHSQYPIMILILLRSYLNN